VAQVIQVELMFYATQFITELKAVHEAIVLFEFVEMSVLEQNNTFVNKENAVTVFGAPVHKYDSLGQERLQIPEVTSLPKTNMLG